ncbi:MAG: isoprenylcysteine carboxylmethyltransferase family protein [Methanosarcina mazei]|uniref:methyltransferase family protein n=1 Tax=Methanosarcina soligelidi TaxID=1036677 RepID=UPI00069FCE1E|nr:isoprenylcysteine carboxylmethyltransferase family protein [Methanosarcina soligelidi]
MPGLKIKKEDQISWIISIPMILLAVATWTVLDRNWNSLNHLPVYVYAGTLIFYLKAEKFAYRGSDLPGIQSDKWTRYLLLFFWWLLLILLVLEYSLFPGYSPAVTASGTFLAVSGTILRAWGIWTLGKYFSVHIEVKDRHELIESGPYRFIRHPAYAGNLLQAVGIPLILNAYYSLSISAVLVFLFLYRLKLEEETLLREVNGYKDYVKRTYRLIPKIW